MDYEDAAHLSFEELFIALREKKGSYFSLKRLSPTGSLNQLDVTAIESHRKSVQKIDLFTNRITFF